MGHVRARTRACVPACKMICLVEGAGVVGEYEECCGGEDDSRLLRRVNCLRAQAHGGKCEKFCSSMATRCTLRPAAG
jgi:hypothetical protein